MQLSQEFHLVQMHFDLRLLLRSHHTGETCHRARALRMISWRLSTFAAAFGPFASFMQYDILRSSRKSEYLCQAHEMSRNNLSEFELAVLFTQFIVLITLLTDVLSLNMLPCELSHALNTSALV